MGADKCMFDVSLAGQRAGTTPCRKSLGTPRRWGYLGGISGKRINAVFPQASLSLCNTE